MFLVALVALLLALTSLLAYLGRFSWVLDNLASFRPQLTVALLVLLLLLLVPPPSAGGFCWWGGCWGRGAVAPAAPPPWDWWP